MKRVMKIGRQAAVAAAAMIVSLAVMFGMLSCVSRDGISSSGDKSLAASDQMVITGAKNCPDADKEVAAVKAASKALRDATTAYDDVGRDYDEKGGSTKLGEAQEQADAANKRQGEIYKEWQAAKEAYETADAAYLKAKEAEESAFARLGATSPGVLAKLANVKSEQEIKDRLNPMHASFDKSLYSDLGMDNLSAAIELVTARTRKDSLKSEHDKNVALKKKADQLEKDHEAARQVSLAKEKEVEAIRTKPGSSRAGYEKARDALIKAQQDLRKANIALAEKCPAARGVLEKQDPTHSPGQDIFTKTKAQHTEPGPGFP